MVTGIYFVSVISTNIMLEVEDLPSLGPGLEALLNRLLIN